MGTIVVATTIWDYPAAIIIGSIGGLMGALYIWLNLEVNKWRKKLLKSNPLKIIETVLLAFVTATVFYWIPEFYTDCETIPENLSESARDNLN